MDSIASLVLAFMGVDGEINILGKIGAETTIAFHCHLIALLVCVNAGSQFTHS